MKKYYNITQFKSYLLEETVRKHENDFKYINKKINNKLKEYKNFDGIDFCDVSANGIQIRGHHKEIKGYTFGEQPTIKYDFSNVEDAIEEFVDMWKKCDNSSYLIKLKNFIAFGEKYGWD